jgi:class 3 adenylate cyclase
MAELPSGTVTFLFTDIAGSIVLWERDRAAIANAAGRHLALLRATIEAHGGVLIQVAGSAEPCLTVARSLAAGLTLQAMRFLLSL